MAHPATQALRASHEYAQGSESVNRGRGHVRQLLQLVQSMKSDSEEPVSHRQLRKYCAIMYDAMIVVKATSSLAAAKDGVRFIECLREIFNEHVVVQRDCVVNALFNVESDRLNSIIESDWLMKVAAKRNRAFNASKAPVQQPQAQTTMAYWFGNGIKTSKEVVRLPDGSARQVQRTSEVLVIEKMADHSSLAMMKLWRCREGCGRSFSHAPGRTAHEKACSRKRKQHIKRYESIEAMSSSDGEQYHQEPALLGELSSDPDVVGDEEGDNEVDEVGVNNPDERSADEEEHATGGPGGQNDDKEKKAPVGKKRRLDGRFKLSGLKEGDRRLARTLYFKYEVVKYYRSQQELKKRGLCPTPGDATVAHFGAGITKGMVSTWAKKEDMIRSVLLHGNVIQGRGARKGRADMLVKFNSRAARKVTLHKGKVRPYAAAEAEVHASYREKRKLGLPVTAHYLRITMKKTIRQFYGDEAADSFKASPKWLQAFTRYFEMSLRRKTNKKHMSIEERMPKCQRWHARFRRRLKGGPQSMQHPKWGRWLPFDRISIDQVPCNLREGGGRTYEDKGSKRVWLVGSKVDCGKRFCTLQVAARCGNGDLTKPRNGQPKITIVFRGQGIFNCLYMHVTRVPTSYMLLPVSSSAHLP